MHASILLTVALAVPTQPAVDAQPTPLPQPKVVAPGVPGNGIARPLMRGPVTSSPEMGEQVIGGPAMGDHVMGGPVMGGAGPGHCRGNACPEFCCCFFGKYAWHICECNGGPYSNYAVNPGSYATKIERDELYQSVKERVRMINESVEGLADAAKTTDAPPQPMPPRDTLPGPVPKKTPPKDAPKDEPPAPKLD